MIFPLNILFLQIYLLFIILRILTSQVFSKFILPYPAVECPETHSAISAEMALISKKTASRVPGSRFCPRSHLKTGIGVSILPEGSQQQNHSSGLCFVISWKQPTRLGGRESNFFIVAGLCFTTGKDKQIYRYFFFPSASMNFRKYSFSSSLSTDCASLPSSSYRILR